MGMRTATHAIRQKRERTNIGAFPPEPMRGLEPLTHALRMRCSTN